MYLWQRRATPDWWTDNEKALRSRAEVAVIERPDRKRLLIEIASKSARELWRVEKEFGGRVTKLPRDWLKRALRQKTRPVRIGERKLIIPAGAAFGTGEHATTAMCLRMLDRVTTGGRDGFPSRPKNFRDASEKHPYRSAVDLGTGSGILALAAHLLGAKRVFAVDIDAVAIRTAKENARRNRIDDVRFKVGDVRKLRLPRRVDVVVANLFVELLIEILPKIRHAGHLILSGVLRSQERQLLRALRRNGIEVRDVRRRGKWIAVQGRGTLDAPRF